MIEDQVLTDFKDLERSKSQTCVANVSTRRWKSGKMSDSLVEDQREHVTDISSHDRAICKSFPEKRKEDSMGSYLKGTEH